MRTLIILQDFVRLSGPGSLRFILQPLMSVFFGIKDGITDAKLGNDPFLFSLFKSSEKKSKLKEAFKSVGKVFIIAIILIIIFYYFRKFHDLSIIKFLKNAKFPKVILLNVMIFVEVILISKDLNFLIIMAVFQIVYLVLYYQETVSLILKFSQSILKIKK